MDFETCTKPEDSSFESIYCRLVFSVIRQFYMYVLLRVTKVKSAFSSSAAKKYIKACAGKYWLNLWLCFHVRRNSETCTANTNNRLSCWTGVWHVIFSLKIISLVTSDWNTVCFICFSPVSHSAFVFVVDFKHFCWSKLLPNKNVQCLFVPFVTLKTLKYTNSSLNVS